MFRGALTTTARAKMADAFASGGDGMSGIERELSKA
jgi:hypothetical protein